MEFGDTLVQFNIFKAMKHPTEDHSLFSIDMIDELVEDCFQLDTGGEDISNFAGNTKLNPTLVQGKTSSPTPIQQEPILSQPVGVGHSN
ncbi:hypothetical protein CR513_14725, partial [Mucuna pruriens]